ncbi:MAG: hypothetical protein F4X00_04865 [Gemmatimonadetes bacterium]|nr:hypothetical protein [Gemmatimonadota bacterium]
MSPNENAIRLAISKKQPIETIYNDKPRILCPHVIGEKGNSINILSYQIGGDSSREIEPAGSPNNWRCMHLDELGFIKFRTDLAWQTADNHTQPQTCVDLIYAEVSY